MPKINETGFGWPRFLGKRFVHTRTSNGRKKETPPYLESNVKYFENLNCEYTVNTINQINFSIEDEGERETNRIKEMMECFVENHKMKIKMKEAAGI